MSNPRIQTLIEDINDVIDRTKGKQKEALQSWRGYLHKLEDATGSEVDKTKILFQQRLSEDLKHFPEKNRFLRDIFDEVSKFANSIVAAPTPAPVKHQASQFGFFNTNSGNKLKVGSTEFNKAVAEARARTNLEMDTPEDAKLIRDADLAKSNSPRGPKR